VWRVQRFEMVSRGERGYVLKGIEDIKTKLEVGMQSLQGMQASRYLKPFLDRVEYWEKALSRIRSGRGGAWRDERNCDRWLYSRQRTRIITKQHDTDKPPLA